MNIINMSLGGGSDYRTNPVAVLADKLAKERGLVLVAAAGNDGADVSSMVTESIFYFDVMIWLFIGHPFLRPMCREYGASPTVV
jgi:hypothetical protein